MSPDDDALDKKVYLIMLNAQKKVFFYKKSTTFMLSISEIYVTFAANATSMDTVKDRIQNDLHVQWRSSEWMRSVASWLEFVVERYERREKVRWLIIHIPENMLEIWKQNRRTDVLDNNPKNTALDILDNDVSESCGDLPKYVSDPTYVQEITRLKADKAQKVIDILDEVELLRTRSFIE